MKIKAFLETSIKIPMETSGNQTFFLGLEHPCLYWEYGLEFLEELESVLNNRFFNS